jgi:hypothetical protein
MSEKVRYQVLARCFVNDSLVEPKPGTAPTYVMAAPGLEGKALKLAPEVAPPLAAPKPAVVKA